MASYAATVTWERAGQAFSDGQYTRAHKIAFDGGITLAGSSSPHVIRPPLSRADAVDPEEMLVAALSSCHMLSFLDIARRAGFIVDSYADAAEGVLEKNAEGRWAVTRVTLMPKIAWGGDKRPSPSEVAALHHKAHEVCFIANSFRGAVTVAEAVPA